LTLAVGVPVGRADLGAIRDPTIAALISWKNAVSGIGRMRALVMARSFGTALAFKRADRLASKRASRVPEAGPLFQGKEKS
jgi:hypothetical protein